MLAGLHHVPANFIKKLSVYMCIVTKTFAFLLVELCFDAKVQVGSLLWVVGSIWRSRCCEWALEVKRDVDAHC